jgi:hypothetical protein
MHKGFNMMEGGYLQNPGKSPPLWKWLDAAYRHGMVLFSPHREADPLFGVH